MSQGTLIKVSHLSKSLALIITLVGKWLWRSWQSGRFQYQRTRVRIQSLATFIEHLFTVNCLQKKDENKEKKRPRMAHFSKKNNYFGFTDYLWRHGATVNCDVMTGQHYYWAPPPSFVYFCLSAIPFSNYFAHDWYKRLCSCTTLKFFLWHRLLHKSHEVKRSVYFYLVSIDPDIDRYIDMKMTLMPESTSQTYFRVE